VIPGSHLIGRTNICRLKQLDAGIYTQKDAEAAIGLSTDRGPIPEKMDIR
jgi:hypothetical protein